MQSGSVALIHAAFRTFRVVPMGGVIVLAHGSLFALSACVALIERLRGGRLRCSDQLLP